MHQLDKLVFELRRAPIINAFFGHFFFFFGFLGFFFMDAGFFA